jgi:hypothetical protein
MGPELLPATDDAVFETLYFSSAWQEFVLPPTTMGTAKNATIKMTTAASMIFMA